MLSLYLLIFIFNVFKCIDINAFEGKILDSDKLYPKFGEMF